MSISLSKSENTSPPAPSPSPSSEDQHTLPADSILRIPYNKFEDYYKRGKVLGEGKFAVTYICKEKSTDKKYACKSIKKKSLVTESEKQDLRREVTILKRLKGLDNVVELKDTYEDKNYVHLVMEYCDGGELFDQMKSKGRYSERIAAQIFASIMRLVYCLHLMGIMHRDLKPENFLLLKKGALGFLPCCADYTHLKAIDFGLSAYIEEEGKLNQERVGTAFYVAPEVLRRQGYGQQVDIWSAGVILYILLTGVPPFYGENEKEIFDKIKRAETAPLEEKKTSETVPSGEKNTTETVPLDKKKTTKPVPDFKSYPWPRISDSGKKLVKKMLTVDPTKRPTAEAIFKDPWMVENGVATDEPIGKELYNSIMSFRAIHKFKKLAFKVVRDVIPPEKLKEMKAMFWNVDTNENRIITRAELESSLKKLESKLEQHAINQIVEAADADGNGEIDYDEFMAAMMNFQMLYKEDGFVKKVFEEIDEDKSGSISKEELKQAMENYGMAGDEGNLMIEEIFSGVDTNGDHKISLEEFTEIIRREKAEGKKK